MRSQCIVTTSRIKWCQKRRKTHLVLTTSAALCKKKVERRISHRANLVVTLENVITSFSLVLSSQKFSSNRTPGKWRHLWKQGFYNIDTWNVILQVSCVGFYVFQGGSPTVLHIRIYIVCTFVMRMCKCTHTNRKFSQEGGWVKPMFFMSAAKQYNHSAIMVARCWSKIKRL